MAWTAVTGRIELNIAGVAFSSSTLLMDPENDAVLHCGLAASPTRRARTSLIVTGASPKSILSTRMSSHCSTHFRHILNWLLNAGKNFRWQLQSPKLRQLLKEACQLKGLQAALVPTRLCIGLARGLFASTLISSLFAI